jgi:sec-independent protein translocase protein TatC
MADDSEDADRTPEDAPASSAPESDAEPSEPEPTDSETDETGADATDQTPQPASSADGDTGADSSGGGADSDETPESAAESRADDGSSATEKSSPDETDTTDTTDTTDATDRTDAARTDEEPTDGPDGDSSDDEAASTTSAEDDAVGSAPARRPEARGATADDVDFGETDPDASAAARDDDPAADDENDQGAETTADEDGGDGNVEGAAADVAEADIEDVAEADTEDVAEADTEDVAEADTEDVAEADAEGEGDRDAEHGSDGDADDSTATDDDPVDAEPATAGVDPPSDGVDITGGADAPAVDAGPDADGDVVTGTDGGASVDAGGAGGVGVADPAIDDGIVSEGPETDEEMPLAAHIEEMIRRLAVVLGIGGLVTLLLYPGADLVNSAFGMDLVSSTQVIDFLWNKHIPGAPEMVDRRPRVYGPLELVLTELKVAALGGLVVGLPAFVYETYLFMRPGLYPKERRYYLAAVPTSLILAFVGIAFAHFIVLPAIFAYFTSYTTGTALVAFGLKETFNLILILMGYNAIIFQIPLFVMLAIMMNLVTRQWMVDRRLLFWGTFLGLAFLVSPDPTGMAPIIIALTMIVLFEGTLLALRWTGTE